MTAAKLAMLMVLALSPLNSMSAEVNETPEEIVVTGRLPGPPLWKVSNGDKVMWIFPYLGWIPKDMIWENERVARVIAESQEVIYAPEGRAGPSSLVRLNPINVVRAGRLFNRLERNPDGRSLKENLPPELYERFAALRARYFPESGIVNWRPWRAGPMMMNYVRTQEGLVSGDDILKNIRHLVRRNRDIKRTEISESVIIGDSFSEFAARAEAFMQNMPPEQEQLCFEQQVRHMEEDIDEMKSLANSWAQGYIDEFRNIERYQVSLAFDELPACSEVNMGGSSTEREMLAGLVARLKQRWLDAAENALATNISTFAILGIPDLLAEDGLLSQLKAKGYEVQEP